VSENRHHREEQPLNIAGKLGRAAMESNLTPIFSVLIFLVGLVALFVTPREENPQIDVPAANVIVRMDGASPEEVLNQVVRPLEMVLGEMQGVDHTFGSAMGSLGVVTVTFKVGEEKEASLVKLYDRVMHNLDRIPPGASQPLVKPLDVDDVPIVVLTLSSQTVDELELKRLAERVKEQLEPIPGVSVADIIGGRNRQVIVELDPARIAAHRIPLESMHRALLSANAGGPLGELIGDNQVSKVWLGGYLDSAEQVGRLVVGSNGGRPVYLRDVVSVRDDAAEATNLHRIGFGAGSPDGTREPESEAVSITLAKKRGTNAVVVADAVLEKLAALKGSFIPDNVRVTVSRDSGEQANEAVNMLVEHLAIAIGSVILIMILFLGWREASIVTLNIPLILFIVLAVGFLADQTINRITLFALILALGLLVDDAIVVIENIHRHFHHGIRSLADKGKVIIAATNETGKPTIVATFAVVLAFIPMAFVTGMMGPYMGPIPFNTPVAMIASLIIAYVATPWIARRLLPVRIGRSDIPDEDVQQDPIHKAYYKLALPLIDNPQTRKRFFIVVGLLMAFSFWQPAWQFVRPAGINGPLTPGTVELKMLPKGNKNTFNITIDMPEGTPLEATDAVAREIADVLRLHPQVTDYETWVGQAGALDFNGILRGAGFRTGSHVAEIRVNLVDKRERSSKSDAIVLELRQQLAATSKRHPEAIVKLVEDPPGPPVRATLLAELYGPDYEKMRQMAGEIRATFAGTYDVVDVDDSVGADQREYRIDIDKEKAAGLGVDTLRVAEAMQAFLQGRDIGAIHVDAERHPVRIHVQLPREMRVGVTDLGRIYVSGAAGPVPLSAIATIAEKIAPKPIFTKDGHPVVYITGEPKVGSQVYSLLDIDKRLDGASVTGETLKTGGMRFVATQPEDTFGYHLLWDGEMRLTLDVFRDLGAAFIVALVLIYLLMVAYYGSFSMPILVMGPIAMTLIGIFAGHMIMDQPFTATSMIGMIALAGIVVRNSLLLIDFILDYRAKGYSVRESVLEAGAVRTRPILLTALAVIAGTAIMISDPVFGGLGVSMAFGTLSATVLTLFVIPLAYYLWKRHEDLTPNDNQGATSHDH